MILYCSVIDFEVCTCMMVYVFRFMNPLMELVIYLYELRIKHIRSIHTCGNYFGTLLCNSRG